jgi:hypothetical protein
LADGGALAPRFQAARNTRRHGTYLGSPTKRSIARLPMWRDLMLLERIGDSLMLSPNYWSVSSSP